MDAVKPPDFDMTACTACLIGRACQCGLIRASVSDISTCAVKLNQLYQFSGAENSENLGQHVQFAIGWCVICHTCTAINPKTMMYASVRVGSLKQVVGNIRNNCGVLRKNGNTPKILRKSWKLNKTISNLTKPNYVAMWFAKNLSD